MKSINKYILVILFCLLVAVSLYLINKNNGSNHTQPQISNQTQLQASNYLKNEYGIEITNPHTKMDTIKYDNGTILGINILIGNNVMNIMTTGKNFNPDSPLGDVTTEEKDVIFNGITFKKIPLNMEGHTGFTYFVEHNGTWYQIVTSEENLAYIKFIN